MLTLLVSILLLSWLDLGQVCNYERDYARSHWGLALSLRVSLRPIEWE